MSSIVPYPDPLVFLAALNHTFHRVLGQGQAQRRFYRRRGGKQKDFFESIRKHWRYWQYSGRALPNPVWSTESHGKLATFRSHHVPRANGTKITKSCKSPRRDLAKSGTRDRMLCQDLPRSATKDASETGRWKVDELILWCHKSSGISTFYSSSFLSVSDIFYFLSLSYSN